jgi:RimJ/RimL family protein N-acetyltransferase
MQRDFYFDEVSNRDSKHRYWAIRRDISVDLTTERAILLGIAGLTNIEWENGRAEVALMISPDERGKGYGSEAFELIKLWGFARMRLHTIYACVYLNNPHLVRWWRERKPTEECDYPGGKFWDGKYHRTYHMTWVNE